MVIDTSAVVAILLDEPEQQVFKELCGLETDLAMSAITFHESSIVMATKMRTKSAAGLVDEFIRNLAIDVSTVTIDDSVAAREAYFRYGRGYHPAKLNFADCFVYALAKVRDDTLLFKGDDFSKTDIVPAWPPGQ